MTLRSLFAWLVACALLPTTAFAQITVSGVTDKTTYNSTVTLTITTQAGFDYDATLNWKPIALDVPVIVNKPDFYELRVNATNQVGGAVTSLYRRFHVLEPTRVGTEWGLPVHVPFPVIQSSSNEFADAHFRLLVPSSFPAGYAVPLVAWVVDDQDHAVRANGILHNGSTRLFQVRRGVGSGFISHTNVTGNLDLALKLPALATNISVAIESNVTWTPISGTLSGATTLSNHSRIHITGGVLIPAGSSLTVGEGTIVRVDDGLNITNNGTITINGTAQNPVVVMGTTAAPWGSVIQHQANASFTATSAIFTGSGKERCWYSNTDRDCPTGISGSGSHRTEQPLIAMSGANCNLTMTDCAAISLAGQFARPLSGGSYTIRLTRHLVQRATTAGEYASANLIVNDSAFIEIPNDSVNFEDEDHDAFYINSGTSFFTNTLFGWTKDDGIDSGGSGAGPLTYQSCWFESTFHEGNSLSGFKNVLTRGTVYFDCGQGIEGGYEAPTSRVEQCFFSMNESGIRHGDNYASFPYYRGPMTATNNISIYNHRDLFGFNWDSEGGWTNNYEYFFASNNVVSALDTNYPNNTLWNPATDAWRLGAFGGVGRVGVGFGIRSTSLANYPDGVPVGLSRFCTNEVQVDYVVDSSNGTQLTGTLIFPQGLTRRFITVPTNLTGFVRIVLSNPQNADVTGNSAIYFANVPTSLPAGILSPLGADWKYLDNGAEQGTAWRANSFDDSNWSNGVARLGFGPDPAPLGTTIRRFVTGTSGPQVTNFYFRRAFTVANPSTFTNIQFRYQRDDGCIVYLNTNEMFRNNMAGSGVTANSFATTNNGNATATLLWHTNIVSVNNVLAGTNVVAVEVHQSTATSSDLAWEMELQGLGPVQGPRLNIAIFEGDAILYWNDATFALEEADFVTGPWRPSTYTQSPAGAPLTGNRFFRLRR